MFTLSNKWAMEFGGGASFTSEGIKLSAEGNMTVNYSRSSSNRRKREKQEAFTWSGHIRLSEVMACDTTAKLIVQDDRQHRML